MTVCRLLLLSAAIALTACTPSEPANTPAATQTTSEAPAEPATHKTASAITRWQCGELDVSTHFDDPSLESITLETSERMLTLKSMVNEDGARFADAGGNEFWSRPGKVSLTLVGQPTVDCKKLTAPATATR